MQFSNVLYKNANQGFTLLEIIIVIAIAAILGAIVAPSFINLYNVNRANEAVNKARGAIQEAQNQAIRYAKRCRIQVVGAGELDINSIPNTTGSPVIKALSPSGTPTPSPAANEESCLVNDTRIFSGMVLSKNTNPWIISFDSKGRTDVRSAGTMIFSIPDAPQPKKCIVVSPGLGLIRSGDYEATSCKTSR